MANEKGKQYPSWILKSITKRIVALIGIFLVAVISWFVVKPLDWWSKGDTRDKYIAVVITNKSDATFTIPKEFRQGFGDPPPFKSFGTNQNIRFEKMDDLLSTEQAKIIAQKLLADENCIMIIGNSTSSLTEVTLNSILSSKNTKPGFLLPIATADDLIEMAKDQNYNAILRMVPNNERQAVTIKNFIYQKFNKNLIKIAILSDEENTTYSNNLSQKIADKIILDKMKNGKEGIIVLKKEYGNSNRLINDYHLLEEYCQLPDIIVFVGISSNGSVLMEELRNLNIAIPVIFTDGCTVNNLMEKSKGNPNNYFISAVDIDLQSNENKTPTYNPVGIDARELTKLIISRIPDNITRESVAKYIELIRKDNVQMMDNGSAGNYQFDNNGDNMIMKWRVYAYINGKLEKVFDGI